MERVPRWAWCIPAIALLPLGVSLGDEIQEVDPAQYAEVARRIALSGDFVTLHDGWGDFLNKPPMTMWLIALAIKVLGATSLAARLPSLLAACVTVFAVARIGRLLWDSQTGWVAASLYAASPALMLSVADPKIDALVTAFISLTVWCLVEARARPAFLWGAWAFAGCGLLTKGPIGLIIPALSVFPEVVRQRWDGGEDNRWWKRLWAMKPLSGLLVMAAVAAPWFLAMRAQWGNYGPYFILWEQTFGRVLHTQVDYVDKSTPLFFVHTGAWAYLPFSPLFLYALITKAGRALRARALPPDSRRLALWWFLLPFCALSVASMKLPQYAFWLAPAAALVSARALVELTPRGHAWAKRGFWASSVVGVIAVALVLSLSFPGPWAWVILALAVPLGLSFVKPGVQGTALTASLALFGFALFFAGHLHPSLLEFQPYDELGRIVKERDPHGTVLPFFELEFGNAAPYYANREAATVSVGELRALVQSGKTKVVVISPSVLDRLDAEGFRFERVKVLPLYPTSLPRGRFLRASTREETLRHLALVQLAPR